MCTKFVGALSVYTPPLREDKFIRSLCGTLSFTLFGMLAVNLFFPFFFFVISSCQPRNSPSIKNACFHFPSFIYGSKYGSSLFFRWLNCGIKRFHGQVLSEIYGEALIPKWLYFCFRTLCREGHTPSLFSVVTSVELKFGCGKMPRASLIAQLIKNPPAMQETLVLFLGREDPLEKE